MVMYEIIEEGCKWGASDVGLGKQILPNVSVDEMDFTRRQLDTKNQMQ